MKTLTAAMTTHINGELTTLATCWHITRTDGVELFITDHDADIVYGGDTYTAASGIARTSIESAADMSVDNLDVVGILGGDLDKEDLLAGHYDFAEFDIFSVNWVKPDVFGKIQHRFGTIGEIQVKDGSYTGELRGMMQLLERRRGKVWAPDCRANLFSPLIDPFSARANGCGVASAAYEEDSMVETVISDRSFTVPATGKQIVEPKYLGEWGDERGMFEPNAAGRLERIPYGVGAGAEDGSPNRPIVLNSASTFVADMNGNLNAHFILATSLSIIGNHTPIGTAAKPFSGTLDGRGFSITYACDNSSAPAVAGLFGYVNGIIRRLGVLGAIIESGSATIYAGGIAAILQGEDATAHPLSGAGRIQHCFSYGGLITTDGGYAGGLVGFVQTGAMLASCVAANEMVGTMGTNTGAIYGLTSGQPWLWGNVANTDHAKTTQLNNGGWGNTGMTDAEFQVDANFEAAGGTSHNGYNFNDRHDREEASGAPGSCNFIGVSPAVIGRVGGSFLVDGLKGGEMITISGSINNDGTYRVRAVGGTSILLDVSESLITEFGTGGVTYTATTAGPWIKNPGRGMT